MVKVWADVGGKDTVLVTGVYQYKIAFNAGIIQNALPQR